MLPELFLERMKAQLGEEYPAFLESLERPRAVALRYNPLKGEQPKLPFVLEQVPWEPRGYYYDPEARPGLHPYHEAGVYYLQEASAMAPVTLLDPQPGEWICDLCAAPGGKSTQIAGRMGGKGFLLCNEYNPKRARILSRNIERMGIANALVTNEHPANLAKRLAGTFDRVLIDAPCSGEGMFRKEEAAVTDVRRASAGDPSQRRPTGSSRRASGVFYLYLCAGRKRADRGGLFGGTSRLCGGAGCCPLVCAGRKRKPPDVASQAVG